MERAEGLMLYNFLNMKPFIIITFIFVSVITCFTK